MAHTLAHTLAHRAPETYIYIYINGAYPGAYPPTPKNKKPRQKNTRAANKSRPSFYVLAAVPVYAGAYPAHTQRSQKYASG